MKIKQSGYLLRLFLALFLCLGVAQAADEYGACFYPKTGIANLMVMWGSENIPTAGIRSQAKVQVAKMRLSETPPIATTRLNDAYRVEQNSGESRKRNITITWDDNSFVDVEFENGSPSPTKSTINYDWIAGEEVTCIIRGSFNDLKYAIASYGVKAAGQEVKSLCTDPKKMAALFFGSLIIAYICG